MENNKVGLKSLNSNLGELLKIVQELKDEYNNKIILLDKKLLELDQKILKLDQMTNDILNN